MAYCADAAAEILPHPPYAKQTSKTKETFGKGNIEGVIGSEAANDAVEGGAQRRELGLAAGDDLEQLTAAQVGALEEFLAGGEVPADLLPSN